MTKTSKKVAVVLFLLALALASACSHLGIQSNTPPKGENGDCSKAEDSSLAANVKKEFSKKLINKVPEAIKLDSKGGVVTLTGQINYEPTKKYAGEIAKGVKCVKDVVNNIEVTAVPGCSVGDKWCCCEIGACECLHVRICPICAPKVATK
jgi:osmotically-inducible protein OsmY